MSDAPAAQQLTPTPIPFRVNFVMEDFASWEAESSAHAVADPDCMPERFRNPETAWIAQSYMRLRRRGHDVCLTDRFVPGEVCIALEALKGSNRPHKSFAISIQYHLLVARICDFNIVQNQLQLRRSNQRWLPHWPQPGLVGRDPSRNTRLERVGYFGDESLASELSGDAFRARIANLGVKLVTPKQWNDYTEIDAVLAVRNIPSSYLAYKPASKLYNAWAAGCPALLGPEPAFAVHRKSELDYFEVCNSADALGALARLKSEPELYSKVVANGLTRSREFTFDAVSRQWEQLLSGPVAERFAAWQRGPTWLRDARNLSRFVVRWGLHKQAIRNVERYNLELIQSGHDWRKTGPGAQSDGSLQLVPTA